ncbi:hypothetical protein QJS10_CPB19g01248 [Acorus calamus]|uniref:Leucine-rich repeat-containing N-terminal plant-type domain-containing protein n=1 Tax=Acorus calamus TaxID=4465 RepID=A0AAV9CG13_ACOCL|nr:hypothetical protein QJS10_CPB19g01248 [Acorus calamus]
MLEDWVGGGNCCNWTGVECDAYRAVSIINLLGVRDESSQEWYPNASLFGQFTELKELRLGYNGIAGWVNPQDIWHLQKVQQLFLEGNHLNDESIARLIVPWIHNLKSLFGLYLGRNNLKEIRWISNITSLSLLDLSGTQIKDFSDIWHLKNVQQLYLRFNNLNDESIVPWIYNLTSLFELNLRDLCQLQHLQYLDLSGNSMKGNIDSCLKSLVPTQVCHMQNLHILDLSNNHLVGTIPNCLKNITSWIIDSPIDYPEFKVNPKNEFFDISYDTVVSSLITKGPIPNSFQNLENIESLDLSNNNLSGGIPSQLVQLHSLSVFRVSYNNFSGFIPYNVQFCTFNKSSFEGNPGLSGELLIEKKCWSMHGTSQTYHDSSNGDHEDTSKAIDNDVIFYSFIAASFAIGFWGVIAVLAFNKNGRIKFFMAADDFLYACMDVILDLRKRIEKYPLLVDTTEVVFNLMLDGVKRCYLRKRSSRREEMLSRRLCSRREEMGEISLHVSGMCWVGQVSPPDWCSQGRPAMTLLCLKIGLLEVEIVAIGME